MVVAREDLEKIRKFLNFWLEKIEMEVIEEEEFEYPKYLLRSTLCNLLSDTGDHANCLRLANFNIKEITSEIRHNKPGLKEKARILVLSILYKVGAMIAMREAPGQAVKELIKKCEYLVEKFGLSSESNLMDTIKKNQKLVAKYEAAEYGLTTVSSNGEMEKLNDSMSRGPTAGYNARGQSQARPKSVSKGFIIKGRADSSVQCRKSPDPSRLIKTRQSPLQKSNNFEKIQPDQTRERERASPKVNGFFVRKNGGNMTKEDAQNLFDSQYEDSHVKHPKQFQQHQQDRHSDSSSQIQRPTRPTPARQARKEFKEGLDGLLKLGEFVKSEIIGLQSEIDKPQKHARNTQFFDSSDSVEKDRQVLSIEDPIQKEITFKMETLMKSQLEWEKERKVLQEKLDRLEKTIEKQTTVDESNSQAKHTPTNAPTSPNIFNSPQFYSPGKPFLQLPGQSPATTLHQNHPQNTLVPIDLNRRTSMYSVSGKSEVSGVSRVVEVALQGYHNALKSCLKSFERGEIDFSIVKQLVPGQDGEVYMIDFVFSKGTTDRDEPKVTMNLRNKDAEPKEAPLFVDTLTAEQLKFLFRRVYFQEVIPTNIPATCFPSIGMFLQTILSKFVKVKVEPSGVSMNIEKTPKVLVETESLCNFLGTEHTVSLVHLNERDFRLIIRKAGEADEPEAITAEVLFNEFVLGQFFDVHSATTPTELLGKIVNGETFTQAEKHSLRSEPIPTRTILTLISTPEKQVDIL